MTDSAQTGPALPRKPYIHDLKRFDEMLAHLQRWRNADHENAIYLSRSQIIEIIEGVEQLRRNDLISNEARKEIASLIDITRKWVTKFNPQGIDAANWTALSNQCNLVEILVSIPSVTLPVPDRTLPSVALEHKWD